MFDDSQLEDFAICILSNHELKRQIITTCNKLKRYVWWLQTCAITMNMMAGPPLFKRAVILTGEARVMLHPALSEELSQGDIDKRYTAVMLLLWQPTCRAESLYPLTSKS